MGKAVLTRRESCDFVSRWNIPGHDHLVVESQHEDGSGRRHAWMVCDIRFTPGMDRWNRNQVIVYGTLDEVRDWVRAGGPSLWDPERRKEDRSWRPIPNALALVPPYPEKGESGPGVMTRRDAAGEAKLRAGLILQSMLNLGWVCEATDQYGRKNAELVAEEMAKLAARLVKGSGSREA